MVKTFLALGSNVGDSRTYIDRAITLIGASVRDIVRAPLYKSHAVGYTDQPDFVNTAIMGNTELSPAELLAFVKRVEQEIGRIDRFRWGPREIDIDIIFYSASVIEEPNLIIPHERFRERDFVLRPIQDIDPGAIDPVTGLTVADLLHKLPPSEFSILDTPA